MKRGAAAHGVVRPRSSCDKCALCQAVLQQRAPSFTDIALYERRVCWGEVSLWLAAPLRVEPHRAALLGELQTLSASGPDACLPSHRYPLYRVSHCIRSQYALLGSLQVTH